LDLSDQCFALLGSGSEVGPIAWLAGWRARLLAIDLPGERNWRRLEKLARRGNATLLAPSRGSQQYPGANLLTDLPELIDWIAQHDGPVTLGSYAYLDGSDHLRVSAAMDSITRELAAQRSDLSLAMLATPTDVYLVPAEAAHASRLAYDQRRIGERLWQRPLQLLSAGRLLRRNYPAMDAPGMSPDLASLCDSLVLQQGVN
ncbi:MAG: hypothetical protein VW257_06160, partial [Quisquiliibacterium sp.]